MKSTLLFTLFLSFSICCFAQKRTITGTIYDDEKNVLADANVIVKNSEKGTITDEKGQFRLEVEAKDILQVSYLSFETKEIVISEQKELKITLVSSWEKIDAVEVIACGVVKSSRRTICQWTIKEEDVTAFKRIPTEQRLTSLFPNPSTNGIFQLQLNESYTKLTLEVYNMNGQLLQSNTHTKLSKIPQIDLSKQAKGIYLIRVIADGNVLETKKAIRS
ncbi:carboxypeptidase-like regulatory domain-containing protein [Kordia sp.]|uniref:T9SS type A sorting domain-containing protein n=1 Tax=Kordia sp. TaxID=1965332 RepID=UPI003D6C0C2B